MSVIGQNIKRIRIEQDLSQQELADKIIDEKGIPISRVTITRYENGRDPNIGMLHKIAEALEVSINELLGTTPTRAEFEEDFNINVFDEDVMQYILNLKKALKKNYNGENITNTIILQNLIIDRMAKDKAQKITGMFVPKMWMEFSMDESGNLITGKKLQRSLIESYKRKYLEEKLRLLESRFENIYEFEEGSEELEEAREYYDDIPKHFLNEFILEKMYPEYSKKYRKRE